MGNPPRPPTTEMDAMIVTLHTVEAFMSLPWEQMSKDQQQGALLLYDQLLSTVKPLLPRDSKMTNVLASIERSRCVANTVRGTIGAGPTV